MWSICGTKRAEVIASKTSITITLILILLSDQNNKTLQTRISQRLFPHGPVRNHLTTNLNALATIQNTLATAYQHPSNHPQPPSIIHINFLNVTVI